MPKGRLKLGGSGIHLYCAAFAVLLLTYHRMYPEVEVVIKSGATEDLMDLAKSDEIDLIFTFDKKIYSSQWTCEQNICVCGSQRELAVRRTPYAIVNSAGSISTSQTGAAYRYELEQMLSEQEIEIAPILEIETRKLEFH